MYVVGNILNRAHNYFQDFWKRFSIFNKAQQLQLNRKQKQIKKRREREAHLGLTYAVPAHLARPSRLALPVVVLLPPGGRGARGRRPGDVLETSRDATPTPTSPSHPLSLSPSSPSLSPAMAERVPRRRSP